MGWALNIVPILEVAVDEILVCIKVEPGNNDIVRSLFCDLFPNLIQITASPAMIRSESDENIFGGIQHFACP